MVKLVLLRHGESIANQQNTYTGWSDVGLTAQGKAQAAAAGKKIAATGILFEHVHTSVLSRAIMTAYIVQDAIGQNYLPITKSWPGSSCQLAAKLLCASAVVGTSQSFTALSRVPGDDYSAR